MLNKFFDRVKCAEAVVKEQILNIQKTGEFRRLKFVCQLTQKANHKTLLF